MLSSIQPALWHAICVTGALFTWSYAAELPTSRHATPTLPQVDAIYVIGMKHCQARWNHVFKWARADNLQITPVYATHYETIDMRNPPIPVIGLRKHDVVKAGQVSCTMSHIRAWRDAFVKNHSRIIVLEDDVRMTKTLLERLPSLLTYADEGSARRNNSPWHYIFLRTAPTEYVQKWQVWHRELYVAPPGWGTAAYVLSRAGVRYLLTRITAFSHPLDVQLERLQKGRDNAGARFVALDACGRDEIGNFPMGCSHNIRELSPKEKGNCAFSGTQSGAILFGRQMPGAH